jgi:hypothetical protein
MDTLLERSQAARQTLEAVISRVCGACVRNCCHQGTMMGSQDVRRLVKGVRIEPGRGQALRAGLRLRCAELRADLAVIRRVAGMLAQVTPGFGSGDPAEIERHAVEWERFCDLLDSDFPLDFENLVRLQMFSAIRSNTLHVLARFPGALSALVNLGRGTGSFRFVHKRIAPPRCLYHVADAGADIGGGCIAGRWKPAKCANFFCPGDPNVLHAIRDAMSFDEFVAAHMLVSDAAEALSAIRVEVELGPAYLEPKILVGFPPNMADEIAAGLRPLNMTPAHQRVSGHFLRSTAEVCSDLESAASGRGLIVSCDTVDGVSLYELAVALDRFRAAGKPQAFYLIAANLRPRSFIPHPLWADEMMAQPLSSLDILLCRDRQPASGPESGDL